jgi:purine-binding chemotaxis protein CheW
MKTTEALERIGGEIPANDISQFLTFKLGGEVYGVNILQVKEIIDYGNITEVPMMPKCIAGVINLRGSVVPVVDLAHRFEVAPCEITKRSSIVIVEVLDEEEKLEVGITVDVVNEVLDIETNQIEQTPSFGTKIRTDFIQGMGKVNDVLLIIIDINNVLSVDELSVVYDSSV